MDEIFIELININFYFSWLTFGRIFAILILVVFIIVVIKIYNGTSTISLGFMKIKNNKEVQRLQNRFEELNKNNNIKTYYLKLLNQAIMTINNIESNELSKEKLITKIHNFYDFYLHGITTTLTNGDNIHRVAIFYKYNENELKILHGHGFSPEGKEKLRLDLYESKAGYSFIQQKVFHSGDITQDSTYVVNPKSSKKYHSLLCIPIIYGDKSIGVLSVDGLKINSFDSDDIDYLTFMANSISLILYKELNVIFNHKTKEKEDVV